ncbi:actin-binding protein WASF3-like isoform X2 [Ornithodoros turicata]|uniref:actin-binding protein WASF3-like isoform X2 n=1 Tax=Ornithodoros turicata TaxID=34597 RepID=UPI00313A3676
MPLLQRIIEPVHVCRGALPLDPRGALAVVVPSELECVTNGTLANVVRQLSSLSKHADDLFGVLLRDAAQLVARTGALQARVDRLAVKVTQLDSTVEEVSLQDIHMRKAFRSSIVYDQQVVSRASMPAGMLEMYQACDKPPPLDKLNPYREDGKDGLKFYTDPNYFFDLWRQEMLKDTERIMMDRGKKPNRPRPEGKRHKKVRQPHNTRERLRQIANTHEFLDHTPIYGTAQNYGARGVHPAAVTGQQQQQVDGGPVRPSSLELSGPADNNRASVGGANHVGGAQYPLPPPAYTEHPPPQSPPHHQQYTMPPPYMERVEYMSFSYYLAFSQQQHTPPMSVASPANGGTPTRQGRLRPSQPPPAPPTGSSSSGTSTPSASASGTPASGAGRHRAQRETLPPPPPPPEALSGQDNHVDAVADGPDALDLPPPPPTPEVTGEAPPSSRPSTNGGVAPAVAMAPPPPPPPLPPPNEVCGPGAMANGALANGTLESESVSSGSSGKNSAKTVAPAAVKGNTTGPGFTDPRSDLLAAIREGIKLRRVEDLKQKQVEKAAQPHDVASILARRVAIEVSDSDSGSGSEYDSDWDNETEC